MQIKTYEPAQTGPAVGDQAGSFAGERRSTASFPARGLRYAGMEQFGNAVTKIGKKIQHAAEVQEYADAMVKATAGMTDIYRNISQDPQFAESSADELDAEFARRSSQLRDKIASGMKEYQAKKAFENQYAQDDLKGRIRIRDMGRQRFVSRARASTDEQVQALSDNLIATGDLDNIPKANAIVDGKVAAGIFTAEEGRQLKDKFSNNAIVGYYERLIEDPKTAVAAFEELTGDGQPAALGNVDERTKSALVEKARAAAKKANDDALDNLIITEMRAKFPADPAAAAAWLENPKHYPKLDFEGRARMITYFNAIDTRQRLEAERARKVQADGDRLKVFSAIEQGDIPSAAKIVAGSKAMDSNCLLYTSPSPRDRQKSRMPSSA
jgi:hypothetical protein